MEEKKDILNGEETVPFDENISAAELSSFIEEVLDSKKAHDITNIEVGDKTIIAERFILCTGGSNTQVRALTDEVEFKTEQRGLSPLRVEGRDNNVWVIMDYGTVIVHIFSREARQFYNLDKLYE